MIFTQSFVILPTEEDFFFIYSVGLLIFKCTKKGRLAGIQATYRYLFLAIILVQRVHFNIFKIPSKSGKFPPSSG